jgi:L-rhamnose mutarotase
MTTKRLFFALDLKDDERLIAEYEHYHKSNVIWPEIVAGIKECNILEMDIYRVGNRLLMVLETNKDFDLTRDFARMGTLPRQKEWAELMLKFQQRLPFAKEDEHWVLMKQIFILNA